MHRQVLGLEYGDKRQGDHIHHGELRIVTHRQNVSKHVGVSWDSVNGLWFSRITLNKKQKNLGRYAIEKEASDAYQNALSGATTQILIRIYNVLNSMSDRDI